MELLRIAPTSLGLSQTLVWVSLTKMEKFVIVLVQSMAYDYYFSQVRTMIFVLVVPKKWSRV